MRARFSVAFALVGLLYVGLAAAEERETILLNGSDLTLSAVARIAENQADVAISPQGIARIKAARKVIDHYVDNNIPAYGVNTMYGQDVDVALSQDEIERWNRTNVFQEATDIGDGSRPFLKPSVIRAAWALLVNSYAKGFSGVSIELAETLVERVNTNRIPENIEDGGSVGDADLIMNNKLTVSLYDTPGFKLGAGEATALMTHSFISIARAALVAQRFQALLAKSKVALALVMEGYRANPSPISPVAMKTATTANKRDVQREMQSLLRGSKLWSALGEKGAPRELQDFLSLRVATDVLAAVETSIGRLEGTLVEYMNAAPLSPMVDIQTNSMLSVTEWDPTQLTLDMDQFRQAMAFMAIAVESRSLKALGRPFSDLPSGLVSGDPTKFDGLYTRNIPYWMTSLVREVLANANPVTTLTASYQAEGHEDFSAAFPDSVAMAEVQLDRLEKMVALEALIGSYAIERRFEAGQLVELDLPEPLRALQQGIVARSPLHIEVGARYSLAELLEQIQAFPIPGGIPKSREQCWSSGPQGTEGDHGASLQPGFA